MKGRFLIDRLKYIVIEGNIGAGKTSLATQIATDYNAKLVLEQFADNPFLPKFYQDPERFSFPLELSFLAARYHQMKEEMTNPELFHAFLISDYYFMKSLIFAGSTLKADEYVLYRQLFMIIYDSIPKPNLYVYLHVDTDQLLNRIVNRGRPYEMSIKKEYLERIQKGYFDFFKQNAALAILVLDVNELDFVGNQEDYDLITDAIFSKNYEKGVNRVILKK